MVAKPIKVITPEDRMAKWQKLWGSPRLLDSEATEAAFEEFQESFIPGRIQKHFQKLFGTPKSQFGNRYFMEDAQFQNWDTKLTGLADLDDHVEVVVIYGSPDDLEAHALRGDRRRSLRDIVIDDWQAACAIVRARSATLYVFVEPKMRGCVVRKVSTGVEDADVIDDPSIFFG